MKAKITRITWETASGWQVSEDVNFDADVTRLEPVKDACAEFEGRPPRWNTDGAKIRILAERLEDGRVAFTVCAPPDVPQATVDDYGRLFELMTHLQPGFILAPESRNRLRDLVRERFPTLAKVSEDRLISAAFNILREPAAWRENMSPEDRLPYLARAAWNAINDQPAHDGPDPEFKAEAAPADDAGPSLEAALLAHDIADKARALALRDGERQILEAVLTGDAGTWTEARDMAGLPDSHRVGLLKKLKALAR